MGEREKLNTYLSGDIGNYGRERNLRHVKKKKKNQLINQPNK
jgi:hypothetical protein